MIEETYDQDWHADKCRHTDTQTHDTQTDAHTDTRKNRSTHIETHTNAHANAHTKAHTDTQTHRHTDTPDEVEARLERSDCTTTLLCC
jgi:hypothetical protein